MSTDKYTDLVMAERQAHAEWQETLTGPKVDKLTEERRFLKWYAIDRELSAARADAGARRAQDEGLL